MSEKRFHQFGLWVIDNLNFNGISIADLVDTELMSITEVVNLLNEQQATIQSLEEEKGYWKNKAMTLLMQVRRLTPRMSAKEVIAFSKELEDE